MTWGSSLAQGSLDLLRYWHKNCPAEQGCLAHPRPLTCIFGNTPFRSNVVDRHDRRSSMRTVKRDSECFYCKKADTGGLPRLPPGSRLRDKALPCRRVHAPSRAPQRRGSHAPARPEQTSQFWRIVHFGELSSSLHRTHPCALPLARECHRKPTTRKHSGSSARHSTTA
jgi:hypothetical protein